MAPVKFQNDFAIENKGITALLIIQLVCLAAGFILQAIDSSLHSLLLWLALFSIFSALFFLLVLYVRYRLLEVVKRKKHLINDLSEAQYAGNQYQTQLTNIQHKRKQIEEEEQGALAQERAEHDLQQAYLKSQRETADLDEDKELSDLLEQYQNTFIQHGLNGENTHAAEIDGIGPKMKEKLIASGINSASDVNPDTIHSIPGFGKAKTEAVFNWLKKVEQNFNRLKPRRLPEDQVIPVRQKYQEIRKQYEVTEKKIEETFLARIAGIRQTSEQQHYLINAAELPLKKSLHESKEAVNRFSSEMISYKNIGFFPFLKLCILPKNNWMGIKPATLAVALPVLLACGLIFNTASAVNTTSEIIIASIPTATSTATLTNTPTNTATTTNTPPQQIQIPLLSHLLQPTPSRQRLPLLRHLH